MVVPVAFLSSPEDAVLSASFAPLAKEEEALLEAVLGEVLDSATLVALALVVFFAAVADFVVAVAVFLEAAFLVAVGFFSAEAAVALFFEAVFSTPSLVSAVLLVVVFFVVLVLVVFLVALAFFGSSALAALDVFVVLDELEVAFLAEVGFAS